MKISTPVPLDLHVSGIAVEVIDSTCWGIRLVKDAGDPNGNGQDDAISNSHSLDGGSREGIKLDIDRQEEREIGAKCLKGTHR